jgi:hypothetical protein
MRVPRLLHSPVLQSALPVVARSQFVRTDVARIRLHAQWLAGEELPFPTFVLPILPLSEPGELMDFVLVSTAINFAFTDFRTRRVFRTEFAGREWSDAEAMFACLARARQAGVPVLDGAWLARVTPAQLRRVFRGNMEIPLILDRAAILRETGEVLVTRYNGRFRNFVRSGRPLAFDRGRGLVERLAAEFPRFRDVSRYRGQEVKFYKLAQLGAWILHCSLRDSGAFALQDAHRLTAFADYVLPMALHKMGILRYSPRLARAIQDGRLIPRDSSDEIEIRAHTIYAVALLTEEINLLRPRRLRVIPAQLDARLWTHFHTSHGPHHLTRTIMY